MMMIFTKLFKINLIKIHANLLLRFDLKRKKKNLRTKIFVKYFSIKIKNIGFT
jgi:hypothetical protein